MYIIICIYIYTVIYVYIHIYIFMVLSTLWLGITHFPVPPSFIAASMRTCWCPPSYTTWSHHHLHHHRYHRWNSHLRHKIQRISQVPPLATWGCRWVVVEGIPMESRNPWKNDPDSWYLKFICQKDMWYIHDIFIDIPWHTQSFRDTCQVTVDRFTALFEGASQDCFDLLLCLPHWAWST